MVVAAGRTMAGSRTPATETANVMTIAARLINKLTAKPDGTPPLHAAEHLVAAANGAYRTLEIARYPGLIMLHAIACGAHVKVLSYWRSSGHFQASKAQFGAALGSAGKPYHGPVDHLAAAARPWWRKVSAYNAVVTLVALLSMAKTLEGHVDWFFAAPEVSFNLERHQQDIVAGKAFEAQLALKNQSPVHQRLEVRITQGAPQEAVLSIDQTSASIPNLAPGASHTLRISGRVLKPAAPAVIVVAVTAKAGLLRRERTLPENIQFAIWPDAPLASRLRGDAASGRSGVLRGQVINGAPAQDIECRLSIRGVPGLRYSGEGEMIPGSDPGEGNYLLVVNTGIKSAFKVTDVVEQFESDRVQDWKQVAQASRMQCLSREPAS